MAAPTAPGSAQRWWELAMASLEAEQWAVAEGALRRLIVQVGEQPSLLDPLGYSLLGQGRFAAAEAVLRRALAGGAANFWIPHKLGDALRGQQRLEEAVAAYEQALAEGSDSPLTVRNLLEVLDRLATPRALERLQQFAAAAPATAWSPLSPWQNGAIEAAGRCGGPELALWLSRQGCPEPAVRRVAWQESLQRLEIGPALQLLGGGAGGCGDDAQAAAIRQRLAGLVQPSRRRSG